MANPISLAGLIPPEQSNQIIAETTQQSVALQLGTKMPMGTKISQLPVAGAFPTAAWVSVAGGRKSFTDLSLALQTITAEEVAAVVSIPDEYLEDSSINLWGYARPLLAEAIAAALDDAVLWGTGAPATFPTGGVAAVAQVAADGDDAVATVNNAMGLVEGQGLEVTGSAADLAVKALLRGVRDTNGALLLGTDQVAGRSLNTLYGAPIAYESFPGDAPADFITGAWKYLIIGVRQDIRYQFSKDGVVVDNAGKVIISAFQDNQTLLKVWARFGAAIVKPPTRRVPAGANPFAMAELAEEAPLP